MQQAGNEARRAAEHVARESYGRLLAFLAARTRDIAGAEDALAEAFATALQKWPEEGVPDNPTAWLLTVARRRQTDGLRRRQTRKASEEHLRLMADEIDDAAAHADEIPDRRLGLMFACAHPAIERGMRTPLMLQAILGLTAQEVAAAFLVSPTTMGQRLVRAKARIKQAGIPLQVPERREWRDRLEAVLDAIYAAYGKGWSEMGDGGASLAEEAIWLGQLIVALLPEEPEPKGMLALMLYAEARRPARRDSNDSFVPLDEQDVALWNAGMIGAAERLLGEANAGGPSGRYQIQAAIQSAHVARRLWGRDTWPSIVALYDHLLALTNSPVVALNRAVALGETEGAEIALGEIRRIGADKRMADYQPYWAALGHFAAQAGQQEVAREALTVAMGLTLDPAVRHYLRKQIEELCDG